MDDRLARVTRTREVKLFLAALVSVAVLGPRAGGSSRVFSSVESTPDVINLQVPQTLRTNLELYRDYNITVATPGVGYSSFSLQVHTQLYVVTVSNGSSHCEGDDDDVDCFTSGSNVGLVQVVWNRDMAEFPFHVRVECNRGDNCSRNSSVKALLATVGIPTEAPIPGGCTLTSNLFIDPNLVLNYTKYSTQVAFQDSDIGFSPRDQSYPTCDVPYHGSSSYPLESLEYTIYQKCLGRWQFSVSEMFDAIEDMLTASLTLRQESSYSTLQYNDLKTVKFASIQGQGVVYNVIATDKRTKQKVAYVPAITYACDIHSSSCKDKISPFNGVVGIVLIFAGLFLCFVGHLFFHGELVALHWIGGSFFSFVLISIATTSLEYNVLLGLSVLFGTVYCLVWFLFWFLTGWHWVHVVMFGLYSDFLIISSILYSPLEDTSVFTVLQISYVYYLTVFCGMVLFMVPIVAFPRALSIWASSLVGSYTVIFGLGMYVYTELSEIILLVVRRLSISGFYSAHIDCPLLSTDYILMSLWIILLLVGLTIQTTVVQVRRSKHNRRQRASTNRRNRTKFSSFPRPSLLRKLLRYRAPKKGEEEEPLLTPSRLSSPHCPWSLSSSESYRGNYGNGGLLPSNGKSYRGNYGATGATTVNEQATLRIKK